MVLFSSKLEEIMQCTPYILLATENSFQAQTLYATITSNSKINSNTNVLFYMHVVSHTPSIC